MKKYIADTTTQQDTASIENHVQSVVDRANSDNLDIISLSLVSQGGHIVMATVLKER